MFSKIYKNFLTLFLFLLIARLFSLQILKGVYFYELSVNNYLRVLPLPGYRGNILDRYGRELAGNRLNFKLQVLPDKLKSREQVFKIVSEEFDLKTGELSFLYLRKYQAPFLPITLVENVDFKKSIILREKYRDIPGFMVIEEIKRDYRYNDSCSHILGYLGEISEQELARLKPYGYKFSSLIGKSGVEKEFEPYLKGEDGGMLVKVDSRGRIVEILNQVSPQRGLDVYLTTDLNLQKKAEEILGHEAGCLMAMDVNTGEILALASSPSYDPNIFLAGESKKIFSLLSSERYPLFNRCIQSEYPLGSIFKLLIAIAGLEAGKITLQTKFFCSGHYEIGQREYSCWVKDGHGWQDLKSAIVHSCNSYFYQAGLKIGIHDIVRYAQMFGFGEKTGIDLPYELNGLLPNPDWKLKQLKEAWYPGDTVNLSIGQGYILVTPLQVLRFISAIANGGYLVRPLICKSISGEGASYRMKKKLPITEATLKFIRSAMKDVVNDPTGTGQLAQIGSLIVCGKTATAQVSKGAPHSWFVGFAPYDKPQIAFVVCIEHGGGGGFVSARMAKEFLEYYFNKNGEQ